jgi:two-component system, OmpR family, sensor kinase
VARTSLSTRVMLLGFLAVVTLMLSGAVFSLVATRQAASRIDSVVAASLERERLIGLMRLDAVLLTNAASDHINAASDEERTEADNVIDTIYRDIRETSSRYVAELPKGEAEIWRHLNQVSQSLVDRLDDTVKASSRREAERARKQLQEEVRPISFELDRVANELARANAQETREVLAELQEVRMKSGALGSAAVGAALILSMVVALLVVRTLRQQGQVIDDQLKALNRRNAELDAFASRVAHDLIAPLSPLKGYLTLARRQSKDDNVKEILGQAESATKRMSELVEALLKFCRSGKTSDKTSGALDTAVETILLEQSQAAAMANVQFERALDSRVLVQCSVQLLQSMAQNVVSNAVKYSAGRPNAAVSVKVFRQGPYGVLQVADNGPGIATDAQAQLFEPFFRAAETVTVPGTGLGLATTKRLVDAHGGVIDIQSAIAQGTLVSIRIPLAVDLS